MLRRVILMHRHIINGTFCVLVITTVFFFHRELVKLAHRTDRIELELSKLHGVLRRSCNCAVGTLDVVAKTGKMDSTAYSNELAHILLDGLATRDNQKQRWETRLSTTGDAESLSRTSADTRAGDADKQESATAKRLDDLRLLAGSAATVASEQERQGRRVGEVEQEAAVVASGGARRQIHQPSKLSESDTISNSRAVNCNVDLETQAKDELADVLTLASRDRAQPQHSLVHNCSVEQKQVGLPRSAARDNHFVSRRVLPSADELAFGDASLVIYNRIPKTGSTTFAGLLYDLCEQNKFRVIHMNISKNWQTLSVHDQYKFVMNVTNWNAVKPALYHGHFAFVPFEKFGSTASPIYINLLRDPLERLVSYYYFLRNGDATFTKKRRRTGDNTTFDECVEMNGSECDASLLWKQVSYFCGHTADCRQPSKWALQKAKQNLVDRYFLVGMLEEFMDFLKVLQISLPRYFAGIVDLYESHEETRKRLRQTVNKIAIQEKTRQRFRQSRTWQLEQDFYEFARQLFHEAKQRLMEVSTTTNGTYDELTLRVNEFRFEKIKPALRVKRRAKQIL